MRSGPLVSIANRDVCFAEEAEVQRKVTVPIRSADMLSASRRTADSQDQTRWARSGHCADDGRDIQLSGQASQRGSDTTAYTGHIVIKLCLSAQAGSSRRLPKSCWLGGATGRPPLSSHSICSGRQRQSSRRPSRRPEQTDQTYQAKDIDVRDIRVHLDVVLRQRWIERAAISLVEHRLLAQGYAYLLSGQVNWDIAVEQRTAATGHVRT